MERLYGVYPALVTSHQDPDNQGRVRVKYPWSSSDSQEAWARLATLMGGAGKGSFFIPEIDDEVLVTFEAGDPSKPYVMGCLWNGSDRPPERVGSQNETKVLKTRSGMQLRFTERSGQEEILIQTPAGQTVKLKDGPGSIELQDANGNSVKLDPSGITVNAAGKVTVGAATVEISAGMVTVNAGMSKFSGVVQADTVITNSVVSAAYTPGAGNIW
ncbi:phage baseplate assembly protein V [Deinococcus roseus]|uniref:Phage tail protein n=1 Tax=Deinococcus roseus TaxID=392414 RepID=A0ABQ2CYH7_9DEIO|nr:phage baseplate assembly protein V [Deinococcus roseus]GGJ33407.1 phage tail protein [Deinococcus roseus]